MTLQLERRLFSVHEYHCMIEAGILDEDERVELIEGEIVRMSPIGHRHAARVAHVVRSLIERVPVSQAVVWPQNSIRLGDLSEPQPDVVLLRPRADGYAASLPGPADVLLLIELSDSSVQHDRDVKAPLYARHGISEYWLSDLDARRLTLYRDPTPGGYATLINLAPGQTATPLAFPSLALAVSDFVGTD